MKPGEEAVVWHDVECADYAADLPVWRELAAEAGGAGPARVLDLGCGTGRVALDLAERGHDVWGVDAEPALVDALAARARARRLRVRTHAGDARTLRLDGRFDLAIAPMQVVQLLGGPDGRAAALAAVRTHLEPGATFAVALADPFEGIDGDHLLPPLPDMREEGGWVFSSTPLSVRGEPGATVIERVRQAVSPSGELLESAAAIRLDAVAAEELETVARRLGFRARPRREVPPTDAYVGSTVVVLEAVA